MSPDEPVPLTSEIVEDDEALDDWVDVAIRLDPVAEARASQIAEWREWLKDACEPDLWKLYLEVERRSEERWEGLATVLVQYAFAAARGRPPLKSGEVSR